MVFTTEVDELQVAAGAKRSELLGHPELWGRPRGKLKEGVAI